MAGYLIKVTYVGGNHDGEVYFLKKGGHVLGEWQLTNHIVFPDEIYASEGIARRVCKKFSADNAYHINLCGGNKEVYEPISVENAWLENIS